MDFVGTHYGFQFLNFDYLMNKNTSSPEQMDAMFQQHVKTPLILVQQLQEEIIKNKGNEAQIYDRKKMLTAW